MGQGINLAAIDNPETAAAIDNMKDQLLIVLIKRAGGTVEIPCEEIDNTTQDLLMMEVNMNARTFHFSVGKKQ